MLLVPLHSFMCTIATIVVREVNHEQTRGYGRSGEIKAYLSRAKRRGRTLLVWRSRTGRLPSIYDRASLRLRTPSSLYALDSRHVRRRTAAASDSGRQA